MLDAWDKNPFNVLKKEHFVAYRINWTDKATNIKELASELNIGLDSFVFVDDNPTERELIKQMLPMVEVPEFPTQPYGLMSFFKQLVEDYFKVYSVTDEDKRRLSSTNRMLHVLRHRLLLQTLTLSLSRLIFRLPLRLPMNSIYSVLLR